ncbi:polygalacturonase 1 beta-like protein 2 [Fagus crenata]
MVMPDIKDRMPKRSFLPQAILSKSPFSTLRLSELKGIFHARENSSMERVLVNALAECERAPSLGESKQCLGSVEDMIDFAVSVLGHNVVLRSTKNVNGSKQNVMIGSVKEINGGEVTNLEFGVGVFMLGSAHVVPLNMLNLLVQQLIEAKLLE